MVSCSAGSGLVRPTWPDLHGPPGAHPGTHSRTVQTVQSLLRFTAGLAICTGIAGAFWYCLTTTLDDMTRADCNAGVVAACQALKQP